MNMKELVHEQDFYKLAAYLINNQLKFERVGSSVVPSATDPGDYDLLVLGDKEFFFEKFLIENHWMSGGSEVPDSEFISYKKHLTSGVLNVILTTDEKFFETFSNANAICVEADLKHKLDRIAVYDYMFNRDNKPTEEHFSRLVRGETTYNDAPF